MINKILHYLVCVLLIISFNKLSAQSSETIDTTGGVFTAVDKDASFQGGSQGWTKFLIQNLNGTVPSDKGAPPGIYRVEVKFVISNEGKISDIKALTNHGYGMEEEVIRIIKLSPDWMPAELGNKKVNAYRHQPVTFEVIKNRRGKRKS